MSSTMSTNAVSENCIILIKETNNTTLETFSHVQFRETSLIFVQEFDEKMSEVRGMVPLV